MSAFRTSLSRTCATRASTPRKSSAFPTPLRRHVHSKSITGSELWASERLIERVVGTAAVANILGWIGLNVYDSYRQFFPPHKHRPPSYVDDDDYDYDYDQRYRDLVSTIDQCPACFEVGYGDGCFCTIPGYQHDKWSASEYRFPRPSEYTSDVCLRCGHYHWERECTCEAEGMWED